MFAHMLRENVFQDRCWVPKGLVKMTHDSADVFGASRVHLQDRMMRPEFPGNQIRLINLIEELAIAKADAESFYRKRAVFCCKRGDGSGIETTTEEHA